MFLDSLSGVVGICSQLLIFVLSWSSARRATGSGGMSALIAGAISIYGVALVQSLLLFFQIPMVISNAIVGATGLYFFRVLRASSIFPFTEIANACYRNKGFVTLLALVAGWNTFLIAIKPELSIDGLLYHGPTLANIANLGSLWGWNTLNDYSYYTDLTAVSGVNLATLAGRTIFDDGAQLPHLLLLLTAVAVGISRTGLKLHSRLLIALTLCAAPAIWLQGRMLYTDVAYAAAVLVSVLLIANREFFRSKLALLALGSALGGVLATKPTGALVSVLLLMISAVLLFVSLRSRGGPLRLGSYLFLLIPFALGSVFYLRNLILFRNPFYPVDFNLGGIRFPGLVDFAIFNQPSSSSANLFVARVLDFFSNLFSGALSGVTKLDYDPRIGGFGLTIWLPVALSITGLIFWLSTKRRERVRGSSALVQGHGILWLSLAIVALQPMTSDSRYVIAPFLVLAMWLMNRPLPVFLSKTAFTAAIAALAVTSISFTELRVYGGAKSIVDLATLSASSQLPEHGNALGKASVLSWLPPNACSKIAIQTEGGLTPSGMAEKTRLSTLSYALFGEHLCNSIVGVNTRELENDSLSELSIQAVSGSDFFITYAESAKQWETKIAIIPVCYKEIAFISGSETYPMNQVVLKNICN